MVPLYAALYGDPPAGCPPNCVWTRQIESPLRWFAAFFRASGGMVEREFALDCFLNIDMLMEIVLDASPWGLAGLLVVNGKCVEFFSSPLAQFDVDIFQIKRITGSPRYRLSLPRPICLLLSFSLGFWHRHP